MSMMKKNEEIDDANCAVKHLNCKEAFKWYKRAPEQIDVLVVSVQKLLEVPRVVPGSIEERKRKMCSRMDERIARRTRRYFQRVDT